MKPFYRLILLVSVLPIAICCVPFSLLGSFGQSKNLSESKKNGFYKAMYIPDRFTFKLLDSTTIEIDTAWAETIWAFDDKGNKIKSESFGYNLVVPIKRNTPSGFIFSFELYDKFNQAFTAGITDTRCVLNPKHLKDSIIIELDEKNPDTALGWMKPLGTYRVKLSKAN